jgi:glyceraldehyde 3-phosphate dehydrogenase
VSLVLPELKGKLDGIAVRVPTPDGSLTDFTCVLDKKVNSEDINNTLKKASETELRGIMEYTEEPLVSIDIIGNPHSSIIDGLSTKVIGENGNFAKILSWYDNEWGYSCRIVDLINFIYSKDTNIKNEIEIVKKI